MDPRLFAQGEPGARAARWARSVCGLCSVGCGIDIGTADGRIVGVRGRERNSVSRGRLGPKGLNQWHANNHPTRALYPMIRNRGRLVRASWDDAMSLLVEKTEEILATEGPDGVGFYNTGQLFVEDYYTLGKIVRGGIGSPNIDANTRLCTATTAAALMESFGADGPPGCYADFDETECIVLVGHNMAEQSTVLWMRVLAAKAGPNHPKVIVIDPRRTFTVDTGADLHLQLRPGTNVALLNGICALLIENGWIDREFVDRHTVDFENFRRVVRTYTPEKVEEITSVPAAKLRLAAEWIGTSKSTVSTCLQGVYQSNQATAAACTINSMHLIMGKIGKPGSAPFQFAGQPSSMSTRETGADGSYPAYRNWDDVDHMRDLAQRWNVPAELLGKKPVSTPEMFELCEKGFIKLLWTIATNPAASMTDRPTQLQALRAVFLVVQDGFADSETAQLADIFLPAAIWGEKTGCMTNAERRCQLLEKAIDPPGDARPDLDIFIDFSKRLGLKDKDGQPLIGYRTPEGAFDEWRKISKGMIPDYSGMTYAKLRALDGIQWPCNDDNPEGTPRLYTKPEFPTYWRISETYQKDMKTGHEHTLQEYKDQLDPKDRAFLVVSEWEPPLETTSEEFPLIAISGRQVYHWHTRTKTAKAAQLAEAAPGVFVEMNDADARRLRVADGDMVRVVSRRGEMQGPAKVGDVVAPGVIFVPFHYGDLGAGTSANDLMPKLVDPVSKQPVQKMAAVRVERVRGGADAAWWTPEESLAGSAGRTR